MLTILVNMFFGINSVDWCGFEKGFYIDVNKGFYELFAPIDNLTGGYIQVDCNE